MADLSAYLNFSVLLDKSGISPVMILSDTSNYPAGIAAGITGFFSITQPDGITSIGDIDNNDITFTAGALTTAERELRLATDNNLQKGQYSISYFVQHAGYDDTTLTKGFTINYDQPTIALEKSFDVFVPLLKVYDQTDYNLSGFNTPTVGRAWRAVLENIGTINTTGSELNLLYNNKYWDASYAVTLTLILTYVLTAEPWVSIQDKVKGTASYKTEVPASLNQIYADLTSYQKKLSDKCCSPSDKSVSNYLYAFTLFQHLIFRIKCGTTSDLKNMVSLIYGILHNGADPIYKITNTVIQKYDGNFCGNQCNCDEEEGSDILRIVIQPLAATKNAGESNTLSVTPGGGVGPYTYQWRISDDGGENWTPIQGAYLSAYTKSGLTLADNGGLISVVVTDFTGDTVTSNAVAITVNALSFVFQAQPSNQTVQEGAQATISAIVLNGTPNYIPKLYKNGVLVLTQAAQSSTTVSAAVTPENGDQYYWTVTDANNNTITSNTVTISVTSAGVTVSFGWSANDPYTGNLTAPVMDNLTSNTVTHNSSLSNNFPSTAPDNYILAKEPVAEVQKTSFNNGTNTLVGGLIPSTGSDEFRAPFVVGGFRYYVSRNPLGFDYTQPINVVS